MKRYPPGYMTPIDITDVIGIKKDEYANTSYARPINQYTKGGEFIQSFDTVLDASEATDVDAEYILACARGRRASSGGFGWAFADEE